MIKLDEAYDYYVITDDPAYPGGKAVDADVDDAENGTPYKADWMNDIEGFFQAVIVDAYGEFRVSGNPERVGASDLLNAFKTIIRRMIGEGKQSLSPEYSVYGNSSGGSMGIGVIEPVRPTVSQRVRELYPNGVTYKDIMSIGQNYYPKLDGNINLGVKNPIPNPITTADFYQKLVYVNQYGQLVTEYYSVVHDLYLGTINPIVQQANDDKYR
jgi:hypothetical protein